MRSGLSVRKWYALIGTVSLAEMNSIEAVAELTSFTKAYVLFQFSVFQLQIGDKIVRKRNKIIISD